MVRPLYNKLGEMEWAMMQPKPRKQETK